MTHRPLLIAVVLLCLCSPGCTRVRYLQDITQVSYSERSGTIPPELQLNEQIVVTRNSVTLTRNGRTPDTEVNEGVWEIEVPEQTVAALFERLEAIDCSTIKRVEPKALDIGGGTKRYNIVFSGDEAFYLSFGRGVTYTDSAKIVKPIEAFIQGLTFPHGAVRQYKVII